MNDDIDTEALLRAVALEHRRAGHTAEEIADQAYAVILDEFRRAEEYEQLLAEIDHKSKLH